MADTEKKFEPTLEGVNAALWEAGKTTLQRELVRDPARAISSRLELSSTDLRLLDGMTPKELTELVKPIIDGLEDGRPFRIKALDRGNTRPTQDQASTALKKCTITITFEF